VDRVEREKFTRNSVGVNVKLCGSNYVGVNGWNAVSDGVFECWMRHSLCANHGNIAAPLRFC
jgi:hypothetical protein